MISGIDVSQFNGDMDFTAAHVMGGQEFFICKAGQGNWQIDAAFDRNVSRALDTGAMVGSYWIPEPKFGRSPTPEATLYAREITGRGLHIPAVMDLERYAKADMNRPLTGEEIKSWRAYAEGFVSAFQNESGNEIWLYGSIGFLHDVIVGSNILSALPFWQASYPASMAPGYFPGVTPWGQVPVLHQWTGNGTVFGVTGNVDRNHFNGTLDEFKARIGVLLPAAEIVRPA